MVARDIAGFSVRCATGGEADCTHRGGAWAIEGVITDAVNAATGGCSAHGTHCAGTVGSAAYGVAKGVTLVAVQVLDCTATGTVASIVAGIEWAVADATAGSIPAPPAVLSMSIGGAPSESEDLAIAAAHRAGLSVVVAAGNEGGNACDYSPSRAPVALTVASAMRDDSFSAFSNHGPCVDLVAPGAAIISTTASSDTSSYALSGTSMACPHVAGAMAQLREIRPDMTVEEAAAMIKCLATPDAISGLPAGTPNRLLYTGLVLTDATDRRARLCGLSALQLPPFPPPPPPLPPSPPAPPTPPEAPPRPPGVCHDEGCDYSSDGDVRAPAAPNAARTRPPALSLSSAHTRALRVQTAATLCSLCLLPACSLSAT